jgi:hypothetical protein
MKEGIPMIDLTEPERLWLEEVYSRNKQGLIFSFKEIWGILHDKLPKMFRPVAMDERLINSSGEEIRILGVVALEKNYSILDKSNSVVQAIRQIILTDSKKEAISLKEIEEITKLSNQEVSLILHLIRDYGQFYNGSSSDNNTTIFRKIDIRGNDTIFYEYIQFPGIEKLIQLKVDKPRFEPAEEFTKEEMLSLNNKIDQMFDDLRSLKVGQEIIWTDVIAELAELKNLYSLNKKNWRQLFTGKLTEMVTSGIITETVSKKIVEYINPIVDKLLE